VINLVFFCKAPPTAVAKKSTDEPKPAEKKQQTSVTKTKTPDEKTASKRKTENVVVPESKIGKWQTAEVKK
jgi:hypothetical protein